MSSMSRFSVGGFFVLVVHAANAAAQVDTPVVDTPVVETPVVDTPVVDTPVVDTPVVETPVVETPVVETPVVETPVVETPIVDTPIVDTPVVETPVVETPVVETPVVDTPNPPGTFTWGDFRLNVRTSGAMRFELSDRPYLPLLLLPRDRVHAGSVPYRKSEALPGFFARARLSFDAEWQRVRAFVQLQAAGNWGDLQDIRMYQGYVEIGGDKGFVRLGRQEYLLGAQRFVGNNDWSMTAQSFDGIRAHGNLGHLQPDFFFSIVALPPRSGAYFARSTEYLGVLSLASEWGHHTIDPYILYRRNPYSTAYVSSRDDERTADVLHFGLRADGAWGNFQYDLEGALQVSARPGFNTGVAHVDAAASLALAYSVPGRAGAEVRGRGAMGTSGLDPFYPSNHDNYGRTDLFGLRNTVDGSLGFSIAPQGTNLRASIDGHVLGLFDPRAPWENESGQILTDSWEGNLVGGEVDLDASWTPNTHLRVTVSYAMFLATRRGRFEGESSQALAPHHWFALTTDVSL